MVWQLIERSQIFADELIELLEAMFLITAKDVRKIKARSHERSAAWLMWCCQNATVERRDECAAAKPAQQEFHGMILRDAVGPAHSRQQHRLLHERDRVAPSLRNWSLAHQFPLMPSAVCASRSRDRSRRERQAG